MISHNRSSCCQQMGWRFGEEDDLHTKFSARAVLDEDRDKIGFSAGFILESIGIEIEAKQDDYLGDMLAKFGNAFPKTKVFSEYARSTLGDVDCRDDPDQALMAWMEREEIPFRTQIGRASCRERGCQYG